MNRKFKKLVAVVGALSMLSSVSVAFAANTTTVTKVEVLAQGSETAKEEYTTSFEGIVVDPSDLVRVTISLENTDGAPVNGGEVTFLSHMKEAEALSNENIQYIDQQTAKDGTVTVTFRPRPGNAFSSGDFIAMAGGEDVAEVAQFNYKVGQTLKQLTLTASGTASVVEDAADSVTFTLDPKPGEDEIVSVTVGKDSETPVETKAYTYAAETGTLTVSNAGVGRTEGTYTVTVSATGYENASANFAVIKKPTVTIPDDKKEEAGAVIESDVPDSSNGGNSVTFPATVTVGGQQHDVSYVVKTGADKVTRDGNTLTLKPDVFAAKVKVTAAVGDVVKDKTIYIVPGDAVVNFGNLGLFSKADGTDAFDDDDTVAAIIANEDNSGEIAEELVTALNLALGRGDKTKDIPALSTLDYNGDTNITLAEYHIFKMLIKNQSGFKPSDIRKALGLTQ